MHPADTEALLSALAQLKRAGNSLFVVEHDLDVIRSADWIVDVGPAAGEHGGEILYSGPANGLAKIDRSHTRRYLFAEKFTAKDKLRIPRDWIKLKGVTRNNLDSLNIEFPVGVFTSVSGVSGSGKSSLVSQALVELLSEHLGQDAALEELDEGEDLERTEITTSGTIDHLPSNIRRLIRVDQKAIGRTPRSNLGDIHRASGPRAQTLRFHETGQATQLRCR